MIKSDTVHRGRDMETVSLFSESAVKPDKRKGSDMRKTDDVKRKSFFLPVIALSFCLMSLSFGSAAYATDDAAATVFFSQGKAVYNPQDRDASRRLAMEDFIGQAIMQALGVSFSPSRLGSALPDIQEKILKNSDRYVERYEIYSENIDAGMYRVVGQVFVSTAQLKSDFTAMGDAPAQENTHPDEDGSSGEEVSSRGDEPSALDTDDQDAPVMPAVVEAGEAGHEDREGGGLSLTRTEVLWAVTENWTGSWLLPKDKGDPSAYFLLSVEHAAAEFNWSVLLPEPGTLPVDASGNVPVAVLLAQAGSQGIQNVVVGTIVSGVAEKGTHPVCSLRVLKVSTGKVQGEIRREWASDDASNQEAALDMAGLVVPQIEQLFRTAAPSPPPASADVSPRRSVPVPSGGEKDSVGADEWTLKIRSDGGGWAQVERLLRERLKNVRILAIEMGSGETKVRIGGVDIASIQVLNGTPLKSGGILMINEISMENRSIAVSIARAPQSSGAHP